MKERPAVTLENVDRAMYIIARIIRTSPDGETYFGYFEHLEAMRDRLQSRETRLDAAIARYELAPSQGQIAPQKAIRNH